MKYFTYFLFCQQLLEFHSLVIGVLGHDPGRRKTLKDWNLGFDGTIRCPFILRFLNSYCIISEDGVLKQLDPETGLPGKRRYKYEAKKGDHVYNKLQEKALYKVLDGYVYDQLEVEGLHKILLTPDDPYGRSTFVFCTQPDLKNVRKLLILIPGGGSAKAGVWEHYVVAYKSLNKGTMLPYIRHAKSYGYDVLVMNINDNYRYVKRHNQFEKIPGSENDKNHAMSVWNLLVAPARNLRNIAIVVHGRGGVVVTALAEYAPIDFQKRVTAVALIDSSHNKFKYNKAVVLPILKPVSAGIMFISIH